MISNQQIKSLFEKWEKASDIFLVDIAVKPGNKIVILIDRTGGLNINDCVELSRFIEGNLDREKEDFELSVSSPGADAPFKVIEQYHKNTGRKAQITMVDNQVFTGILKKVSENTIEIEAEKNKKSKVVPPDTIEIKNIKEIRVIISFK